MDKKINMSIIFIMAIFIVSINIEMASANPNSDLLTLKWNNTFENKLYGQVFPVMGDITGDGNMEIVFASGDVIHVFDGATGTKLWTAPDGSNTGVELVDINNDGVLEIIHTTPDQRVRVLKGDGSVLWTSNRAKGWGQALFPLLIYDINGDGNQTIFFATSDTKGNTGALTMLDHNGNILKDTWLYHPCWGGLSLADPNHDGNFVLYVSDRRYYNGVEGKGLQAYDPRNLDIVWSRQDIFHSSPMAVIADVNKDGKLDVIAQHIVYGGVGVLDAHTGQTLSGLNHFNRLLPTHGTGTVHDVDGNGNLDIILSLDDNAGFPKEFVVFDLVTGIKKFNPHFDFWITWPPEVGDITGDGKMEILVASGDQGSSRDFPLLIYNNKYELIDRMDYKRTGQLMPAKVFDVDGDGYNELVVIGLSGKIYVYETSAPTQNPAPRTEIQRYSEYRRGAAEYVEPPGPKAPIIRDVYPANSATNTSLNPKLSVRAHDYQHDLMNVKFEINNGNGWVELANYNNVRNGNYEADAAGVANEPDKTYSWRVTATDNKGNSNQRTFSFQTTTSGEIPAEIVISNVNPANGATGVPITITELSFDLSNNQNNMMNFTLTTTPDIGSGIRENLDNDRYSVSVSNLQEATMYTWQINVTDSDGNTKQQTYTFETAASTIQPGVIDDWEFRKKITVDRAKVTGDLTNFPVLVRLTDSGMSGKAQANGADILFTSADGMTKLSHEIQLFNDGTGELIAWVRLPQLSATQDTVLYMYYGNPNASNQQNPQGAWDSNYLAVHHFDETSGTIFDSTANNRDGFAQNGVNMDAEGKINGANSFDGIDQRVSIPQVFTNEEQFTIEGWMNADSKQGYAISQWSTLYQGAFIQYFPIEGNYQFYINNNAVRRSAPANTWNHVVATFDGTTARLYVNGESSTGTSDIPIWPSQSLYIGDRSAGNRAYAGSIDEVRFSKIARSQDYVKTSYNNQNNPSTFLTIGPEEIISNGIEPAEIVISNVNPANGATGVPITITELSFDLSNNQNNMMNFTLTTTPDIGSGIRENLDNDRYSVSVSNLQEATMYTWQINVTDSEGNTKQQTYMFETASSTTQPGVIDDWEFRKKITVDRAKVTGDLTNFPVLVRLTDSGMSGKAQANGADILFTSADGMTKLSHEIQLFNDGTGELIAWVRLPQLSATQDTVLYMYYGNPNASNQQNPQGVWDSNYLAVHHFDETSGTIFDSTANNRDGFAQNGVNMDAEGKINGANSFDGIDQRVSIPQVFTNEEQFTIEGWMNAGNKQGYAVSQWSTLYQGAFIQYFPREENFQFYINNNAVRRSAPIDTWNHIVATFDGTTARLYVNGEASTGTADIPIWPSQSLYVGDRSAGNRAFLGSLDEIRLSNIARSQDYVKTSYNNQNNPSTFMSLGPEEST